MDKNVIFLYEKLLRLEQRQLLDLTGFKNFLSLYSEKEYLHDEFFLKKIDLVNRYVLNFSECLTFDYRKYLSIDIPNDSQKIIFLNGFFYKSENLSDDLIFNYGRLSNRFFLKDLFKFYYNYVNDKLNFFYILNSVFLSYFNYVIVPDNIVFEKPLYVLNFFNSLSNNCMVNPRFFLSVGKKSKINIMECYFNFSNNLFVNVSTFLLFKEYSCTNYCLFNESSSVNSHSVFARQLTNSDLKYNVFSFGVSYCKSFYNFFLDGNYCSLLKYACRYVKEKSFNDVICNVIHSDSFSKSDINYCVLGDDESNTSFLGRVIVDVDILGVDAKLKCDGLLLSDLSSIILNPELFILSNDVKCSHGATVGRVDANIMYYMGSRGLSERKSINIIICIFLDRCIDRKNLFFDILNKKIICEYFSYE